MWSQDSQKTKKRTALINMRAWLESAIAIKRKSRLRIVTEAGSIMKNMIEQAGAELCQAKHSLS